jgi:hypothetical protein
MKKATVGLLIVLGLLVFLGTVVTQLPASLIATAGLLPPRADLALRDLQGTLWSGSGQLARAGEGLGRVSWQIPAAPLRPAAAITVDSPFGRLVGELHPTTAGLARLQVAQLQLLPAAANARLVQLGVDLSGTIDGGGFDVLLDSRGLPVLDTTLHYSGGRNQYQVGADWFVTDLPPLDVQLHSADARLTAVVEDRGTPLLRLNATPDGRYVLEVLEAAVRITRHPWPVSDDGNDVIFTVEEQLR